MFGAGDVRIETVPDARLIEPGHAFDRVVRLGEAPDGYRVMNDRKAIKVLIEF